jgi:hypothetical protein
MLRATEATVADHSAHLRNDLGLLDLTLINLTLTQILFIVGLPLYCRITMGRRCGEAGTAHVALWLAAIIFFYLPSAAVVIHLNSRDAARRRSVSVGEAVAWRTDRFFRGVESLAVCDPEHV